MAYDRHPVGTLRMGLDSGSERGGGAGPEGARY